MMQVDDDEVDNCKEEYFSQVSGTAIKSVRAKDILTAEKENYAKPDEDCSWIRDLSDLERAKSLQPIQCQEIGIRTTGRSVPIFPSANERKKTNEKTSESTVVKTIKQEEKPNDSSDSLSQRSCDENRVDDREDSDEEPTRDDDEARKRHKEPETSVSVPSGSEDEDEDVVVPKKRRRVVLADDSDDDEPVEKTENKRPAKPAPKEKAAKPALKEKVAPTQKEKPAPKEKPVASKGRSTKGKVAPVPQKKITDFFSRS